MGSLGVSEARSVRTAALSGLQPGGCRCALASTLRQAPASGPGKEEPTVSVAKAHKQGHLGPGCCPGCRAESRGGRGDPCVVSACDVSHPPSGLSGWASGRWGVWRASGCADSSPSSALASRGATPLPPRAAHTPGPRRPGGLPFRPRLLLAAEESLGCTQAGPSLGAP